MIAHFPFSILDIGQNNVLIEDVITMVIGHHIDDSTIEASLCASHGPMRS